MSTLQQALPEATEAMLDVEDDVRPLPAQHSRARYFQMKNGVERVIGAGLLIPASPLIAACWIVVRLSSKGPGFYRQTRVGQFGEEFKVIKLRTMRIDAEANGPQWSTKGDPRITRIGRILRKLHLDELPQLINVVRGEMVLVGPRPERPEFVELLATEIPGYRRRLCVKPGITGLSQINLPPDSDLRSVERKQVLDLYHIDNAGLWLDKRMVLLTALRLLCVSNDRLTKLMGLDRKHLLQHLPPTEPDSRPVTLQELLEQTQAKEDWLDDGETHRWDDAEAEYRPVVANRPR